MEFRTSQIIINNDGSIVDKQKAFITATSMYTNYIQVVAPFPDSDSVSIDFYLRNARISNYTQYMTLHRDESNVPLKGSDVVNSNKEYFQAVKDWNVWLVPIGSVALAAISKYHAGTVDVSVTFRSSRNLEIETTGTFVGTFGSRKSTTGGDVPVSATEGDFYRCDYLDYYSVNSEEEYTLGDLAIWTAGSWVKGIAYEARLTSSSTEFGVDPAIFGQNIESLQLNTTDMIIDRIAGLEAAILNGDGGGSFADNLYVRNGIAINYPELTDTAITDRLYLEKGTTGYHITIQELTDGLPDLNASVLATTGTDSPYEGEGFYAANNVILLGSATGPGISWDGTNLFIRGTIQSGTITDPQLLEDLRGPAGNDGIDGQDGADGYTPILGVDYFNGDDGVSFKFIGTVSLLSDLSLISSPSKNDAYRVTETEELWLWTGTQWKNMGRIQGLPGTDGINGLNAYFHVAYSNSLDGTVDFSISDPSGKSYIGTYTNFNANDSTNPADYTWVLIKGADGADGTDGINGVNAYLHIAYATSADGSTGFSTTDSVNKTYIGQYTNSNPTDSTNYLDYSWTKIVGPAGADGTDGLQFYLHIAYSTAPDGSTGFSTTDPVGKTYIGTYTDTNVADSEVPSSYTWVLFKGADGIDGQDGADGTSVVLKGSVPTVGDLPSSGNTIGDLYVVEADGDGYVWNGSSWTNAGPIQGPAGADGIDGTNGLNAYVHFAYATSADGSTGFSTTPFVGALYIGQYTDFTVADSTNYVDYTWALFKGADGADGQDGADGLPAYIHYAYSTSPDGSTGFSTTYTGVEKYVGWYTDFNQADSQVYTDYEWSLFTGADGIDGQDGTDGLNAYVHYAYSTSPDGSANFSLTYTGSETYIGWYTDFTQADSNTYTDYEWSLFKGADGQDGQDGPEAKRLEITGRNAYKFLKDTIVPTYTSITLTAQLFSTTGYDWEYSVNGGATWLSLSNTTSTYTNNYNDAIWGSNTSLMIKCSDSTGLATDIFSIYKLYDGNTGIDAVAGYLTNENITFTTDSIGESYDTSGFSSTFKVFYGLTDVTTESTFSVVSTNPLDGMTLYIGSSTGVITLETDDNSWIGDTTSFTVRAVYGDATIDKVFTISKSKKGNDGNDGQIGPQGPGLVFRGEFSESEIYYSTDVRKDVVKYTDEQYYSLSPDYNNATGPWVPSEWDVMTSFASVATDILLANDATINKGLVIGTSSSDTLSFLRSFDKSSLTAGSGYYISGDGKFNFGNTTNNIDWNGSRLSLKGDLYIGNSFSKVFGAPGAYLGFQEGTPKFSMTPLSTQGVSSLSFDNVIDDLTETNIFGGWYTTDGSTIYRDSVSNGNLCIISGSTGSTGTGPSSAYEGTHYMYLETSGSETTSEYRELRYDLLPSITEDYILSFAYHMYGTSVNKLLVNTTSGTKLQIIGDQGNQWLTTSVTIPSGSTYVSFRFYQNGSSYDGDIAIDSVKLVPKDRSYLIYDGSSLSVNGNIAGGIATSLKEGDGFYLRKDGKFRFGTINGNRIEWDGTNLDIISDIFEVTTETTTYSNIRFTLTNNTDSVKSAYVKVWPEGSTEPSSATFVKTMTANSTVTRDYTISINTRYNWSVQFGVDGPIKTGIQNYYTDMTVRYDTQVYASISGGTSDGITSYKIPWESQYKGAQAMYFQVITGVINVSSSTGTCTLTLLDDLNSASIVVSPYHSDSSGAGGDFAYGWGYGSVYTLTKDYTSTSNSNRISFTIIGLNIGPL